jgi:hypothetical protein
VQQQQDLLDKAEMAMDQPGALQKGDYHIAVDLHGGTLLWLVRIEKIYKADPGRNTGSTDPSLLPAWERPRHARKCTGDRDGMWLVTESCSSSACPRNSSCDVRWYAPDVDDLNGEDEACTAARAFADGNADFNPAYLSKHFIARTNCANSRLMMDCIGPKVPVTQSSRETKVKLLVKGKALYAATAAQLSHANHPCFEMPNHGGGAAP